MDKRKNNLFAAALVVFAVTLPLWANNYFVQVGTGIAMYTALAGSWNLIGGLAGYPSFGNVVFFGLGAVLAGAFSMHLHIPYWAAGVLSVVITGFFGLIMGLPLLRLKGHYFSIATLALAEATMAVVSNVNFLGGGRGISMPLIGSVTVYYYLMLMVALLTVGATYLILRAQFGFSLLAIKSDEIAAQSTGINTVLSKSLAFTISAVLGAMVGVVYAIWQSYIDPPTVFDPGITVFMLVMTLIGGAGTTLGPVLGAIIIGLLTQFAMAASGNASSLILGLGIMAVVLFLPDGILGATLKKGRKKLGDRFSAQPGAGSGPNLQ